MSFPFASPHRRAERLLQQRLDPGPDARVSLTSHDAAWLEAHLRDCPRCREWERVHDRLARVLRSLEPLRAPDGFTERTLGRAVAAEADGSASTRSASRWGPLWLAAAATCGLVGAVIIGTSLLPEAPTAGEVAVGGPVHLEDRAPHFVIRSPGVGAARFRAVAVTIVEARGGQVVTGPGAVSAVIPRRELIDLMAELERRGGIRVELRSDPGQQEQVLLRFELD